MMLYLPCEHSGGAVRLSYREREVMHSSANTSSRGYSLLAWYKGVALQLQPITKGSSLAIQYDIYVKRSPHAESNPNLNVIPSDTLDPSLSSLIQNWDETIQAAEEGKMMYNGPEKIAFVLSNACQSTFGHFRLFAFECLENSDRFLRDALFMIDRPDCGLGLYIARRIKTQENRYSEWVDCDDEKFDGIIDARTGGYLGKGYELTLKSSETYQKVYPFNPHGIASPSPFPRRLCITMVNYTCKTCTKCHITNINTAASRCSTFGEQEIAAFVISSY